MAITSYPYENADTTETEYSMLMREFQDPGVIGSFGDASLRVTADGSGMLVKVNAGGALARGFVLESTSQESRAVNPVTTGARVDTVVARFDPASDGADLAVVPGGTTRPGLTQTETGVYELPLADINIPASATNITQANIVDRRPYVGHRVGIWSTPTRPTGPRLGRLGLNTTTGRFEFWNGTTWTDLAPVVTWSSITGKPATFAPTVGETATTAKAGDWLPTWGQVQEKPSTFPPTIGGTSTTAKAGNWFPSWNQVTGKPSSFNPSPHTHDVLQVYWGGVQLNQYIAANYATQATVNNLVSQRAIAWAGDPNVCRYALGPHPDSYNRQAGANRFATWMDDSMLFGRATSSRRYKDAIAAWDVDTAALLEVEPKTFHRKVDDEGVMDFGAIAEEVHDLGLEWLVEYNDEGLPEALREHRLPWALLALARRQQATIDDLTRRVENLEG